MLSPTPPPPCCRCLLSLCTPVAPPTPSTGTEAAAFIQSPSVAVDIMLLDIRMPGVHGVDVMRQAQSPPPYPVIAMTGHVDAEAQEEFRWAALHATCT
jgi:CheY-like chemotaxis protein